MGLRCGAMNCSPTKLRPVRWIDSPGGRNELRPYICMISASEPEGREKSILISYVQHTIRDRSRAIEERTTIGILVTEEGLSRGGSNHHQIRTLSALWTSPSDG